MGQTIHSSYIGSDLSSRLQKDVEVIHTADPDDKEENLGESIDNNDLPSMADLSERKKIIIFFDE